MPLPPSTAYLPSLHHLSACQDPLRQVQGSWSHDVLLENLQLTCLDVSHGTRQSFKPEYSVPPGTQCICKRMHNDRSSAVRHLTEALSINSQKTCKYAVNGYIHTTRCALTQQQ